MAKRQCPDCSMCSPLFTQTGGSTKSFLTCGSQYRDWLAQSCRRFGVEVWAYCQTPDHVHLILTPADEGGLALALSRAHRLYAGTVNGRARQTGHLFQGRYGSVATDADDPAFAPLRRSELIGRPLAPGKRGRQPKGDHFGAEGKRD